MAESSFKNEYPQGMNQAEEHNPDPTPMIVESSATVDIPDIGKKKNSSRMGRKNLGPIFWTRTVTPLEPRGACKSVSDTKIPSWLVRIQPQPKGYEDCQPCLDPVYLRETRPNCIPVMLEKDARSYLPVMNTKKFLVCGDMPIREFVNFIRFNIKLSREKPIFICFKNTTPPTGALMSAIDEENKDEDGFLHITYSGKRMQENSRDVRFTMDECSYKNTYPQGKSRSGSFTMAESSFKNEYPQGMNQAEEHNPDPTPMIVENSATIDIPDIGKKKNSSRVGRKNLGPIFWTRNITHLEPIDWGALKLVIVEKVSDTKIPSWLVRSQPKGDEDCRPCLDPVYLRETCPNCIPVMVEKDARSYLPVMNTKFLVCGDMPIGEFVNFIRFNIKLSREKPIFLCFKNTTPPTGALMSAIDEENKDEDGFLHITYSGKRIQGMTQAETKNRHPTPVRTSQNQICLLPSRSQAIMFDIPDNKRSRIWSRPICCLDFWSRSVAEKILRNPGKKRYKGLLASLDGGYLREMRPNYRPVILEKDARSDIPEMFRKKFLVPDDMPLGEFFDFLRVEVRLTRRCNLGVIKPIFMFFKNTKPPTGALMSAIYEENKDEDGYLHIIYSGEENVCGSSEAQECNLCSRS